MEVYVAARFKRKDLVKEVYDQIEQRGHTVRVKWTHQDSIKPYAQNREQAAEYARTDIDAVLSADIVLVFAEKKSDARGLYVELGAALARFHAENKPSIYVVNIAGSASIFTFHDAVRQLSSLDEFYALL